MLARLALRDEPVALIVADQRMPRMTGIELLAQARSHAPDAKLLLLTAYADTDVAITRDQRHRPRLLPDEAVGPARTSGSTRSSTTCSATGGRPTPTRPRRSGWSATGGRTAATRSRLFLARNHVPYRWYDVERDAEGAAAARPRRRRTRPTCRSCWCRTATRCGRPDAVELADALGLHTSAQQPLYDVCIVGGGPAGLAAAVYAASEGLQHRRRRARGARAARPARARRSRTTSASPGA